MDCSPKCRKHSMLIGKSSWLQLYSRPQVFRSTNSITLKLSLLLLAKNKNNTAVFVIFMSDRSLFVQVDVDIGSSTVANGVLGLVIGVITTLVVDMAFLIQVCFQTLAILLIRKQCHYFCMISREFFKLCLIIGLMVFC